MLRRQPFSLANAAALTLGAGLATTALLFVSVSRLEYDKMALGFEQRAQVREAAIRQGLDEAVEVLTVTNQLFATVNPVTRQQFDVFTKPLLQRYPFIQAFHYHRLLTHAERAAVEAELSSLLAGTVLTEIGAQGRQPAPPRAGYSVVQFIAPLQGNEAAFGLNVAVNQDIMGALERAVHSGKVAATGMLGPAQDKPAQAAGGGSAFGVIMPVYRPGAPLGAAAERRAALTGDTTAIIRSAALVEKILSGTKLLEDKSVTLQVYAADRIDPQHLVYASPNAGRAVTPRAGPPSLGDTLAHWLDLDYRQRHVKTLDVGGQSWHVVIGAAPRAFLADHLGSLSTALGGILFTLLMTAYVQTLVQRSRRVQLLVNDRTADLKLSNQRLIDDVIARKRTEKALQDSEQRFRQLVSMSSDWYWEQDQELRFINFAGMGEKGGVPPARLIGQTRWETVPGMQESDAGRAHIALLLARAPFADFEYSTVDERGETRWFSVNGEPVFDDGGIFKGYRGTGTDITGRKQSEQRIHHIAQHDVLTGLPNRSLLQDRLGQAIAYSVRSQNAVWVMLIDLDRFKYINDSMGHKAGDVLLMTIAARLRSALRDTDTVARLSGDEFVVILTEHADERLTPDIVQRLMDSVAQPMMLGNRELFVTCSIGVAVFPTDGAPAENLVEHADIAMYRAKKMGRNNYQFYTPAMNEDAHERVRIESALRNALARDQFVLHYQPQVDLASGKIVGMEALIRWNHPELGMVSPSRFITVAEETGLIVAIGAWVMRTACAQNKAWQDAGLGPLRVAVNLSARQFGAPNLLANVRSTLEQSGLAPDCLEIELTESLFMSDVSLAVETLHSLKALGVNLSIDDFGTGYSSLSYLSSFPIDVLKIDRSFVADITRDANDAAIVASIIALAHNLKLAVIAEGVETAEQLAYLRAHGCDEMQGFFFSCPLTADDFEAVLRERRCLPAQATLAIDTVDA